MFCDLPAFIFFGELARGERQLIQHALICESLLCFAIFDCKDDLAIYLPSARTALHAIHCRAL